MVGAAVPTSGSNLTSPAVVPAGWIFLSAAAGRLWQTTQEAPGLPRGPLRLSPRGTRLDSRGDEVCAIGAFQQLAQPVGAGWMRRNSWTGSLLTRGWVWGPASKKAAASVHACVGGVRFRDGPTDCRDRARVGVGRGHGRQLGERVEAGPSRAGKGNPPSRPDSGSVA